MAVTASTSSEAEAIIDGDPIPISDAPWQVQLANAPGFFGNQCGGILIAPNLVLTAAHCVQSADEARQVYVVAGSATLGDLATGQASHAAEITMHPDYQSGGIFDVAKNDVALIELATPVTLGSDVSTISLASAAEVAAASGTDATVTGWGLTAAGGSASTELLSATMEFPGDTACADLIGGQFDPALEVCATPLDSGQTVCSGDSGGPLVIDVGGEPKLAGITSWTRAGCTDYAVFADTAAFAEWIATNSPPVLTGTSTTIEGRMFDDVNGNGLQDAGEPGVEGRDVTIQQYEIGSSSRVPIDVATIATGSDGRYTFSGTPGWYRVEFSNSLLENTRFTSPNVGDDDSIDSDATQAGFFAGETEPFASRPGTSVLDAGLVTGTTVSGVVFEDTNANGVRDPGEPTIPGGTLSSMQALQSGEPSGIVGTIEADGSYSMELGPGPEWQLSYFDPESGRSATAKDVGADDLIDSDFDPNSLETDPFTVELGTSLTFDLGLLPEGITPIRLGDVDCSGGVDIVDALVTAQLDVGNRTPVTTCDGRVGPAEAYAIAADVDGNGVANIVDALLIAKCDAGIATVLCPTGELE